MKAEPINISIEFTPNPNTLKFAIDRQLFERGTVSFLKASETTHAPLAKKLFEIPGVSAVMLGTNFITITKESDASWDLLSDEIPKVLEGHINGEKPIFDENWKWEKVTGSGSETEKLIRQILDKEIRPMVARDGGDITFHKFENGIVYLTLQGACRSCPGAVATLKMGVEERLKEVIPEIKEVVQVW